MNKITLVIFVILFSLKSAAQDFTLDDINGNQVRLSELLKKGPVFLQFWATWCVPCKEEMKVLNQIYNKYRDSGFVYVAVSIDDQKTVSKVKPFIESRGYEFITVYDTDKSVFSSYGGQDPPFSVLLDTKGNVIKSYSGYIQGDDVKLENDILNAIQMNRQ
jgi:thiol-disulfide isomerase/thioredoxin